MKIECTLTTEIEGTKVTKTASIENNRLAIQGDEIRDYISQNVVSIFDALKESIGGTD